METTFEKNGWSRDLTMGIAGAAVFGIAAAAGHGAKAMAAGAWAAPAVFLGGAALSLPPLYLFGALGGGSGSASDVAGAVTRSVGRVGIALLGLSAPAVFFSTTMGGSYAVAMVVAAATIVGVSGVVAVLREASSMASTDGAKLAMTAWTLFALALGTRLVSSVGKASGLFGGA